MKPDVAFDLLMALMPWSIGALIVLLLFRYLMVLKSDVPERRHGRDRDVKYTPRDWEAVHNSQNNALLGAMVSDRSGDTASQGTSLEAGNTSSGEGACASPSAND